MIRRRDELDDSRFYPGFTLVEVLVAILVLMIGVVVALRIFPRGFDVFNRTQQAALATQQVEYTLKSLSDHPENLPDSIEPVVNAPLTAWDNTTLPPILPATLILGVNGYYYNAGIPFFTWDNLDAISIGGFTYNGGFTYANYGLGGSAPWLLYEPLSMRVLRRVVGEHCVIPSSVNTAGNQRLSPNYCVRYGPIERASTLVIYDLRYRRMNRNKFASIVNSPDGLYYDIDYNAATLYFPPSASGQVVRVSFAYENPTTATISQLPPAQLTVSAGATIQLASSLPSGDVIVPGSENIYRSYQAGTASSGLSSGQYFLQYRTPGNQADPIGVIFFSPTDAGRAVKIDYTVLDWNIVHDNATVDASGAIELSFLPKLSDQPDLPFEQHTWALYEPITTNSIVMEIVNQQTGAEYPVTVNNPELSAVATQPNGVGRNYTFAFNGIPYFLIQDTQNNKRFYISQAADGPFLGQSGQALAGQTFRVYYRAVHDWSLQIFRAPAKFQQVNSPVANPTLLQTQTLQWSQFAWAPNNSDDFITGISSSATNSGATSGVVTFTSVPIGVVAGMLCSEAGDNNIYAVTVVTATTLTVSPAPASTTPVNWTFYGNACLAVQAFFAGQTIAVDYTYPGNPANNEPPLVRVNGESHTVPTAVAGQSLSQILLAHCPAAGTVVNVRGVSVTVRALWAQSHSGPSLLLQNQTNPAGLPGPIPVLTAGTLPETWLSRQATTILPANPE